MTPEAMPAPAHPTIYIVEDNLMLSEAYAFMLRANEFATQSFNNGNSFLEANWHGENSALLLDLCLPDMSGLDILSAVQARSPNMPVIVISSFGAVSTAVQAMKLGALDFIEKPVEEHELVSILRQALQTSGANTDEVDAQQLLASLTPRERQILDQLANGLSSKEIARQLGISPATVDVHRNRILGKLNVRTTPQAVSLLLGSNPLNPR